jgi:hypothetical protein
MQKYILAPLVEIEPVGDDVVLLLPEKNQTLVLSGPLADALRDIQSGDPVGLDETSRGLLVELGVVIPALGVSRRGALKAGAIGIGGGFAALVLPTVAVASSDACGPGQSVDQAEYWIDDGEVYFTVRYEIPLAGPYSLSNLQVDGGMYEASADSGAPGSSPAESTWVYDEPIPAAEDIPVGGTWGVCANFFVNAGEVTSQVVYRVDGFVRITPGVG